MTNDQARQWLENQWQLAMTRASSQVLDGAMDIVADADGTSYSVVDADLDALTSSKVVSIRYALVTQLLGKIANPDRNIMVMQLAAGGDDAWDARSFCASVVVPWVSNAHNVLGTSPDPYVNNPLRRKRLNENMDKLRDISEWERLIKFLQPLETVSIDELQSAFRRVLYSLVRRLKKLTFSYPIPRRVSLNRLQLILRAFLDESSGGLRPLAVSAALFTIIGKGFSLFSKVISQGINEADTASGMPGDIMCYSNDEICLVVEVKDTNLTLAQAQASSRKAKQSGKELSNLLFAVPGISQMEEHQISVLSESEWAFGLNIYTANIQTLVSTVFILLNESWRVQFLREIGQELDARQDQSSRQAWHELLGRPVNP